MHAIMLVDDEENILKVLKRELQDWAAERECEILTFASPRAALEALQTRGSDTAVVVSDLRMPEMKGSDFLLQVNADYPAVMSILLTGYSDTDEVIKAVKAGIFCYILKPWEHDYLLAEIGKAFDVYRLRLAQREFLSRTERELQWAGEMQRALLRTPLPDTPAAVFDIVYRPMSTMSCSGDYYDIVRLSEERYLILLGDVAGHGLCAAFVTGILKAIIGPEYAEPNRGNLQPAEFLAWLNARFYRNFRNISSLILTMYAAVLDTAAAELRFSSAGHNPPLLVRGGKIHKLDAQGPALGASLDVVFPQKMFGLQGDDYLFMYTDGLIELRPPQLIMGEAELHADVAGLAAGELSIEDYPTRLFARHGIEQTSDDLSLMAVRYKG